MIQGPELKGEKKKKEKNSHGSNLQPPATTGGKKLGPNGPTKAPLMGGFARRRYLGGMTHPYPPKEIILHQLPPVLAPIAGEGV